jgi:serine/threonine protein kinase KIN1/2
MPPQAYNTTVAAASNGSTDREPRPVEEPKQRHVSTSKSGRSSNRLLGDYTLSKTLGAGSMGKVKLATHNVTGEKVRIIW